MNISNGKQAENQVTIALDAMGGDHGPLENVKGAIEAIENDSNLNIINPNSSDDGRISTQTRTTLTIYEYSNP